MDEELCRRRMIHFYRSEERLYWYRVWKRNQQYKQDHHQHQYQCQMDQLKLIVDLRHCIDGQNIDGDAISDASLIDAK